MANWIGQAMAVAFMLSSVVESNHFMGGSIQWRPLRPQAFDGTIQFLQRFAWRYSISTFFSCAADDIGTFRHVGQRSTPVVCRSGCSGIATFSTVYCTDYFTGSWIVGERAFNYNMTGVTYFEISYRFDSWIDLAVGAGFRYDIRIRGNLSVRQDVGWMNTSPSTTFTPLRLQGGCTHNITIPVQDLDKDIVRCRWAQETKEECRGACPPLPGAVLDQHSCTVTWTAPNSYGFYVVAIQIEDFATPLSTVPLSSIPNQFVLNTITSSASCTGGIHPTLVPGETPSNGACITVAANTTYRANIVAASGGPSIRYTLEDFKPGELILLTMCSITHFITASPFKLRTSPVTQSQHNSTHYYSQISWKPRISTQTGVNLLCFQAQSSTNLRTEQWCVTLLVGIVPPNPLIHSVSPSGILNSTSLTPISTWMITFDRNITRPRASRYVRFYEAASGWNIYNVNARSSEAYYSLSGQTLTLSFSANFTAGLEYYILIDSGVATHACGDSQGIADTNFWTFSIAPLLVYLEIAEPILTKLETTTVECTASSELGNSNLILWRNGELLAQVTGDYLSHTTTPGSYGNYTCAYDGFSNSSLLYERVEFQLLLSKISTLQCNFLMLEHNPLEEAILAIFRITCPPCDGPHLGSIVDTHLTCNDSGDYAHFTAALVYTSTDGQTTASTLINNFQEWLSSEDMPALVINSSRHTLDQQCPVQRDATTEEACVNKIIIAKTNLDSSFTPLSTESTSYTESVSSTEFYTPQSTTSSPAPPSISVSQSHTTSSLVGSSNVHIILPVAVGGLFTCVVLTLLFVASYSIMRIRRLPSRRKESIATTGDKEVKGSSKKLAQNVKRENAELAQNVKKSTENAKKSAKKSMLSVNPPMLKHEKKRHHQMTGDSSYQQLSDTSSNQLSSYQLTGDSSYQLIVDSRYQLSRPSRDQSYLVREEGHYQKTEERSYQSRAKKSSYAVTESSYQQADGSSIEEGSSSYQGTESSYEYTDSMSILQTEAGSIQGTEISSYQPTETSQYNSCPEIEVSEEQPTEISYNATSLQIGTELKHKRA